MNYKGIIRALFCTLTPPHLPLDFHPLVANKVVFITSKPVFSQYVLLLKSFLLLDNVRTIMQIRLP